MKTKQKNWFAVALLAGVFLAPSSLAVKSLSDTFDPYLINTFRYAIAAVLLLPWTLRALPQLFGKGRRTAFLAMMLMSVSATCLVLAINYGPASYVATLQLLAPLLLVWYSKRFIGEKMNHRLLMGLAVAAVGTTIMTLLPIAIHQKTNFVFYPLATLFGVINIILYPLATVEYRRANEKYHLPLAGLFGATAIFVTVVSCMLWLMFGSPVPRTVPVVDWVVLGYLGLYVSLLSKLLQVKCYEKVGSALMGIVSYFGSLLAVLLPVLVLGEKLALETAVGGCLIVLGLAIAEVHTAGRHTRRHVFHHHY